MMIPKGVLYVNTDYVNLLKNHGEINLNMITNFEEKCIKKESRAAQDTNILYHCLINSFSKVGNAKVSMWKSQYKVNVLPLGNLFIKVIIREIQLDTNATTTSIRTQLR